MPPQYETRRGHKRDIGWLVKGRAGPMFHSQAGTLVAGQYGALESEHLEGRNHMVPFDLLIKGGHIVDPGQNINGKWDLGVTADRIAAIEPDIPATEARRVIEVRGDNRYVTPGLIDIHTHVDYGATTPGVGMGCCDPDQVGVRAGVTTVLDCGSVGVANIGVLATHVMPGAKTRIIPFVNVGSYAHTMPDSADVNTDEDFFLPSVLLNGLTEANRPLHVVVGINVDEQKLVIITTYEPDALQWADNFSRRII
jgi:predicted amidohydrolase